MPTPHAPSQYERFRDRRFRTGYGLTTDRALKTIREAKEAPLSPDEQREINVKRAKKSKVFDGIRADWNAKAKPFGKQMDEDGKIDKLQPESTKTGSEPGPGKERTYRRTPSGRYEPIGEQDATVTSKAPKETEEQKAARQQAKDHAELIAAQEEATARKKSIAIKSTADKHEAAYNSAKNYATGIRTKYRSEKSDYERLVREAEEATKRGRPIPAKLKETEKRFRDLEALSKTADERELKVMTERDRVLNETRTQAEENDQFEAGIKSRKLMREAGIEDADKTQAANAPWSAAGGQAVEINSLDPKPVNPVSIKGSTIMGERKRIAESIQDAGQKQAALADIEAREADPPTWEKAQLDTLAGQSDDYLRTQVEQWPILIQASEQQLQSIQQIAYEKDAKYDQDILNVEQQQERLREKSFNMDSMVMDPETGTRWHKALLDQRMSLREAKERQRNEAEEVINAEAQEVERDRRVLNARITELNLRTEKSRTEAKAKREESFKELEDSGMPEFAGDMRKIDQEMKDRADRIAKTHEKGPVRDSAMTALQADIEKRVTASKDAESKRQQVKQERAVTAYKASQQAKESWNKVRATIPEASKGISDLFDLNKWSQAFTESGEDAAKRKSADFTEMEQRRIAILEKSMIENGLDPASKEDRALIEDADKLDWSNTIPNFGDTRNKNASLSETAASMGQSFNQALKGIVSTLVTGKDDSKAEVSRVLSNGQVAVNPLLTMNDDLYQRAVTKAEATDKAKEEAIKRLPQLQLAQAEQDYQPLLDTPKITPGESFESFLNRRQSDAEYGSWFKGLSKGEQVQEYYKEQKNRGTIINTIDMLGTAAESGVVQAGAMITGVLGQATGWAGREPFSPIAGELSKLAGEMGATTASETGAGLGLRALGEAVKMAPPLALTLLSRGKTLPMLAIAGAQTSGAQYAEGYAKMIRRGMTHEEAWKSQAGPAVASGLVTAALTQLGGGFKGIEAIASKAGRQAMAQSIRQYWTSMPSKFLAAGTKELLAEELPDEISSTIISAWADGEDPVTRVNQLIDHLPEFGAAVMLLGGIGGLVEHSRSKPLPEDQAAMNASVQADIDGYVAPVGVDPEQVKLDKAKAKVIVKIAQGAKLEELTPEEAAVIGMKRNVTTGKITGDEKSDVYLQDGEIVIKDQVISDLVTKFPSIDQMGLLTQEDRLAQIADQNEDGPEWISGRGIERAAQSRLDTLRAKKAGDPGQEGGLDIPGMPGVKTEARIAKVGFLFPQEQSELDALEKAMSDPDNVDHAALAKLYGKKIKSKKQGSTGGQVAQPGSSGVNPAGSSPAPAATPPVTPAWTKPKPLDQSGRRDLEKRADDRIGNDEQKRVSLERAKKTHKELRREIEDSEGGERRALEEELLEVENRLRRLAGDEELQLSPPVTPEDQAKADAYYGKRKIEIEAKLAKGEPITRSDRMDWLGDKSALPPEDQDINDKAGPVSAPAPSTIIPGASSASQTKIEALRAQGGDVLIVQDDAAAEALIGAPLVNKGRRGLTTRVNGKPTVILITSNMDGDSRGVDQLVDEELHHAASMLVLDESPDLSEEAEQEASSIKDGGAIHSDFNNLSPRAKMIEAAAAYASGKWNPEEKSKIKELVDAIVRRIAKSLKITIKEAKPLAIDAIKRLSNKATEKTSTTSVGVPMMVTKDMRQQLYDKGYTKQQVDSMRPQQAQDAIKAGPVSTPADFQGYESQQIEQANRDAAKKALNTDSKTSAIIVDGNGVTLQMGDRQAHPTQNTTLTATVTDAQLTTDERKEAKRISQEGTLAETQEEHAENRVKQLDLVRRVFERVFGPDQTSASTAQDSATSPIDQKAQEQSIDRAVTNKGTTKADVYTAAQASPSEYEAGIVRYSEANPNAPLAPSQRNHIKEAIEDGQPVNAEAVDTAERPIKIPDGWVKRDGMYHPPSSVDTKAQEAATSKANDLPQPTRPELGKAPPAQRKAIGKGAAGRSSYAEFATESDAEAFAYAGRQSQLNNDIGTDRKKSIVTRNAVIVDRLIQETGLDRGEVIQELQSYSQAVRDQARGVASDDAFQAPTFVDHLVQSGKLKKSKSNERITNTTDQRDTETNRGRVLPSGIQPASQAVGTGEETNRPTTNVDVARVPAGDTHTSRHWSIQTESGVVLTLPASEATDSDEAIRKLAAKAKRGDLVKLNTLTEPGETEFDAEKESIQNKITFETPPHQVINARGTLGQVMMPIRKVADEWAKTHSGTQEEGIAKSFADALVSYIASFINNGNFDGVRLSNVSYKESSQYNAGAGIGIIEAANGKIHLSITPHLFLETAMIHTMATRSIDTGDQIVFFGVIHEYFHRATKSVISDDQAAATWRNLNKRVKDDLIKGYNFDKSGDRGSFLSGGYQYQGDGSYADDVYMGHEFYRSRLEMIFLGKTTEEVMAVALENEDGKRLAAKSLLKAIDTITKDGITDRAAALDALIKSGLSKDEAGKMLDNLYIDGTRDATGIIEALADDKGIIYTSLIKIIKRLAAIFGNESRMFKTKQAAEDFKRVMGHVNKRAMDLMPPEMMSLIKEIAQAEGRTISVGDIDARQSKVEGKAAAPPIGTSHQVRNFIAANFGAMSTRAKIDLVYNVSGPSAHYVISESSKKHGGYIEYNPIRLMGRSHGQVMETMREEMIHGLLDQALIKRVMKERGIKKDDPYIQSGQYHIDFYQGIYDMMTPQERAWTKKTYTSHDDVEYVIGSEFTRMVLQREFYGGITEQANAGLKKPAQKSAALAAIRRLLQEIVDFMARMTKDNSIAAQQFKAVYADALKTLKAIDKHQGMVQAATTPQLNSSARRIAARRMEGMKPRDIYEALTKASASDTMAITEMLSTGKLLDMAHRATGIPTTDRLKALSDVRRHLNKLKDAIASGGGSQPIYDGVKRTPVNKQAAIVASSTAQASNAPKLDLKSRLDVAYPERDQEISIHSSRIRKAATSLSRLSGGGFGATETQGQIVQALTESGVKRVSSITDLGLTEVEKVKGGHEHLVWVGKGHDGSVRAYKVRKPGGQRMEGSVSDYLTRLVMANDLLGDDIRLEGVTDDSYIFWSQPWIHGPGFRPTQDMVVKKLESMGWVKDRHLNTLFHSPDGRIMIEDSHNGNWVFDHDGNLWPIDILFSTKEITDFQLERDEMIEIHGEDWTPQSLTEFWSGIGSPNDIGFKTSNDGVIQLANAPTLNQASLADFNSKSRIKNILNKKGWMIYTAENPNGKAIDPSENARLNDGLKNDIANTPHQQVIGQYEQEEKPFIVIHPQSSIDDAAAIAVKYDQDSVLTRHGLVYKDGSVQRATGIDIHDTKPDDYYTTVGSGDDAVMFTINLDWSERFSRDSAEVRAMVESDKQTSRLGDEATGLTVPGEPAEGSIPAVESGASIDKNAAQSNGNLQAANAPELDLGRKGDPAILRQKNVKRLIEKQAAAHPEALPVEYIKDGKLFRLDEKGLPIASPQEYDLAESSLFKEAAKGLRGEQRRSAYVLKLAGKLEGFFNQIKDQPEVMAGKEWYRVAREKLTKVFGPDTMIFAQFLAATSARTPVKQNFEQALDAYNQMRQGAFGGVTERYLASLKSMEAGELVFRKSIGNNKMGDTVTPKTMREWLDAEGILPRQTNGKKYNANSMQVLNVIAGVWREKLGGPKTAQFSDNLSGASNEATIDVWAARTLHRMSNEGYDAKWRILPEAETGVDQEDFDLGQDSFRVAAMRLGMKPDDLQGVLWFAEKRHWAERGWTRAAGAELSDFSSLLDFVTNDNGKLVLRIDDGQSMMVFDEPPRTTNQSGNGQVQADPAGRPGPDRVRGADAGTGRKPADPRGVDADGRAASPRIAGRVRAGRGPERVAADQEQALFANAPESLTSGEIAEINGLTLGQYKNLSPEERMTAKMKAFRTLTNKAGELLAPNGKPSNLNADQWRTVRTPAFKKWFGDWEKFHNGKDGNGVWTDASGEVSKIVDENGEPMLMYHGSREAGFESFDMTRVPGNRPNSAFFSNNRRVARTYSGSGKDAVIETQDDENYGQFDKERGIYTVFLNIREPLESDFEGSNWDGSREGQYSVTDKDEIEEIMDETGRRYFDYEADAKELSDKHPGSIIVKAVDHYESTNRVAFDAAKSRNDGAIVHNVRDDGGEFDTFEASDVVIVFDPENIKDANNNNGEFSAEDVRILFANAPKIEGLTSGMIMGEPIETGSPIEFTYLHNRQSYTKNSGRPYKPAADDNYDRQFEPSGKYMIASEDDYFVRLDPKQYEQGQVSFSNPIVMEHGGYGSPTSWKQRLSKAFGKTGKALSKSIIAAGYDGVITVDGAFTSEIVDLTTFDESKALYANAPKFYSRLAQVIESKMPNRADAKTVLGIISNPQNSIKAEEVKWSGIRPWIESQDGMISKDDVIDYLATDGNVVINETVMKDAVGPSPDERFRAMSDAVNDWTYDEDGVMRDYVLTDKDRAAIREWANKTIDTDQLVKRLDLRGLDSEILEQYMQPKGRGIQYQAHTLPGGTSYREVVLSMPDNSGKPMSFDEYAAAYRKAVPGIDDATIKERYPDYLKDPGEDVSKPEYTSSHFRDIPNYLAHMRLDDRVDSAGQPGTLIEEIQSDRHQAGREKGYIDPEAEAEMKALGKEEIEISDKMREIKLRLTAMQLDPADSLEYQKLHFRMREVGAKILDRNNRGGVTGVPDAPFRTTWPLHLFKRALADAVAAGKSWIGWTTGETQAERYKLSKQIDQVQWDEEKQRLWAYKDGSRVVNHEAVTKDNLADYIGKDAAKKMIEQPDRAVTAGQEHYRLRELEGIDLKVGGEGMKGFYDTILPKEIGKYVKQWGAGVVKGEIAGKPAPEFEITKADGAFRLLIEGSDKDRRFETQREASDWAEKNLQPQLNPIWRVDITPQMKTGVESGQALFANAPGLDSDPNSIINAKRVPYRGSKGEHILRPYLDNMNYRAKAGAILRSFKKDWAPFFTYVDELAPRKDREKALHQLVDKFAMSDSPESKGLWNAYAALDPDQLVPEDSEMVKDARELLPHIEQLSIMAMAAPDFPNKLLKRLADRLPSDQELSDLSSDLLEKNPNASDVDREMAVAEAVRNKDKKAQTTKQWEEKARQMIAENREGIIDQVLSGFFDGAGIDNPELMVAARLLKPIVMEEAVASGDPEMVRRAQAFVYAAGAGLSETARALRAARDPLNDHRSSVLEILTNLTTAVPSSLRHKILVAPTPGAKRAKINELQKRIKRLESRLREKPDRETAGQRNQAKKDLEEARGEQDRQQLTEAYVASRRTKVLETLKAEGLSEDDIFITPDSRASAHESDVVREAMAKHPESQHEAIRYLMRGYSHKQVSSMTGLPLSGVAALHERYRSQSLKQSVAKWAGKGRSLMDIIRSGIRNVFGGGEQQAKAPAPWSQAKSAIDPNLSAEIERQLAVLMPTATQVNNGSLKATVIKVRRPKGSTGPQEQRVTIHTKFSVDDFKSIYALARSISISEATAFDKLYEYWINNLLSGPTTNFVNIVGNTLTTAIHFLPQRFFEATWNLFGIGGENSASFGEFGEIAKGMLPGIQKAWSNALLAFSSEADPTGHQFLNEPMRLEFDASGDIAKIGGYRGPSIGGLKGRIARLSGRMLKAMDAAFKTFIMHSEVGAQAYRLGKIAQKHGAMANGSAALEQFIASEINTPGSMSWNASMRTALELTFQDSNWLTGIAKQLTHIPSSVIDSKKKKSAEADASGDFMTAGAYSLYAAGLTILSKLLSIIFPFVKTPANILRMGIRKSPLGSINLAAHLLWMIGNGAYRVSKGKPVFTSYGRAQLVKLLAEQTQAFITLGFIMSAAEGDDDDDKKKVLIVGGRNWKLKGESDEVNRKYGGEYTLVIRDENGHEFRQPFGKLEPVATILGTTVDTVRRIKMMLKAKKAGEAGGSYEEAFNAIVGDLANQAEDKSFLAGFSNLMQEYESIKSSGGIQAGIGESIAKSMLTAIIPNIIRQPARNLDEYLRDSKKKNVWHDAFPSGDFAEPIIDIYGEDVKKDELFPGSRILIPAATAQTKLHPIEEHITAWNNKNMNDKIQPTNLGRRDYYVTGPNKAKVPLITPKERSEFERRVAREFVKALDIIVANVKPNALPEKFDNIIRDARNDAKTKVRNEFFPSPFNAAKELQQGNAK